LVKNLSNPDYMQVLLDGGPNLKTLFADLDITAASSELVPGAENDRIPPGFRALAKMSDLPDRISRIALATTLRKNPTKLCGHSYFVLQQAGARANAPGNIDPQPQRHDPAIRPVERV